MKMEMLPSSFSYGDEDHNNLKQLLEAFGSVVSLEEIAAAYCKAGRNPTIAGDILCNLQDSTSTTSSYENTEKSETSHRNEVEDFLLKMLGDGFLLNIHTIHDVVGQCGFDVNKSMDTLIDMSAATLEKCDDIISIGSEKSADLKSNSSRDSAESSKSDNAAADEQLQKVERKKRLQQEILLSLFSHPGRYDDEAKVIRPSKEPRRNRYIVDKPLQLPEMERRTVITRPRVTKMNDDEDEESYEALRKAVKEYWTTMKEYYKAAIEAFVKEEHARAYKLLEEGNFFMKKAREVDEKSAQKLLQPRNDIDELTLDVHDFEPKEAIHILKIQLNTFAGIPAFHYIRVIVGVNDDDANAPLKRKISKFLERDSIAWSEEDNGRILVIKTDEIDREKLSFFKKPNSIMR